MAWLIVVGLVGVVLGWIIRGLRAPSQRVLEDYEHRAQRAERRLRRVATERDDENATVLTLRAALKSERQLLDGVARQSGVEPEAFRKTISREYLGRELVVSPASLVDFDFGGDRVAQAEVESLHQLLRAKDRQLAEARSQIQSIRADVESLARSGAFSTAGSGASAPSGSVPASAFRSDPGDTRATTPDEVAIDLRSGDPVIDLCGSGGAPTGPNAAPTPLGVTSDTTGSTSPASAAGPAESGQSADTADSERSARLRFLEQRAASAHALEREVAELRARLADTSVANDDIRNRIAYRRSLDSQLEGIVDQLEAFRLQVEAEKPAEAQDHDGHPVL